MDHAARLKRLRFRASHRGTREADMMIGGFCDANCERWSEAEIAEFEALLEEQDVDIMGWAIGTIEVPARWQSPMMTALQEITYVQVAR